MLRCARCVRAVEEKMVIGIQPVRARCGYRLCLTQRQATNPKGRESLERPIQVADLYANLLSLLGIDFSREVQTPVRRPLGLSPGKVIGELITTRS